MLVFSVFVFNVPARAVWCECSNLILKMSGPFARGGAAVRNSCFHFVEEDLSRPDMRRLDADCSSEATACFFRVAMELAKASVWYSVRLSHSKPGGGWVYFVCFALK